jgi:hypothetical protein
MFISFIESNTITELNKFIHNNYILNVNIIRTLNDNKELQNIHYLI